MKRRDFSKSMIMMGLGTSALANQKAQAKSTDTDMWEEPAKKLPVRHFDVVVAGGGTAGLFAAIAAGRQGANK